MNLTNSTDGTAAFVIVAAAYLVVSLAIYVWYAVALSRVFPKIGAEPWKGWVPVLNEAEIFARGGVPGWSVVFYFIPIVNIYALYLRAVATGGINAMFGRGTGMTVLALLLPPVWASLLATSGAPKSSPYDGRIAPAEPLSGSPSVSDSPSVSALAPVRAAEEETPETAPRATPATVPLTPTPSADPVVTPIVVAPIPPSPIKKPAVPKPDPTPVAVAPPPPSAEREPGPEAAPVVVSPPPSSEDPESAPVVAPVVVHNPWAPSAGSTPTDQIDDGPVRPTRSAIVAPPLAPAEPAAATPKAAPVAEKLAAKPAAPSMEAAPTAEECEPAADDDDYGETIVVDRRPSIRWTLDVEGVGPFPLPTTHVLLGRKPASTSPDTHALSVPDSTRTLSKVHARLDLGDDGWTITDLNSTNGVLVVGADGTETLLDPGAAVPVPGHFVLGKVGMSISFEDASS